VNRKESLLLVEDHPSELENYGFLAKKAGYDVFCASNFESAMHFLENRRVDILISDLFLSPSSKSPEGLLVVRELIRQQPHALPIVMSSTPDHEIYRQAMSDGALFALKKPLLNEDEIHIAIREAREKRTLQLLKKREEPTLSPYLSQLCKDGLCLDKSVRKWVEIAATSPELPIIIYGETGTGKEEVAKLIGKYRKEKEGDLPFLSVNCSLLSGDLAQSLLFGHKKGSFSGACSTTQGYVGEAHGGILFLDEIHTLSLSCQQKLLRVMNDGTYNRLGDTKELYSKFQAVVASTQDLDDAVQEGRFLLDLRTRLTGCDIHLAPLRDRMSELPILIELYFIKNGITLTNTELDPIITRCKEFYWQGNIRQLYHCLRAMVAISNANNCRPNPEFLPVVKTMYAPK
jgi:DNA-binding NtrC family response regulator